MLAFYMDHNIPGAITEGLRRRGIDVMTAFDDRMDTADDEKLLERASELKRVLFTGDQDFLEIVARWQSIFREFSGVVYAIQRRLDIGQTIEYLQLVAELKTPEEMLNHIEHLPAR